MTVRYIAIALLGVASLANAGVAIAPRSMPAIRVAPPIRTAPVPPRPATPQTATAPAPKASAKPAPSEAHAPAVVPWYYFGFGGGVREKCDPYSRDCK